MHCAHVLAFFLVSSLACSSGGGAGSTGGPDEAGAHDSGIPIDTGMSASDSAPGESDAPTGADSGVDSGAMPDGATPGDGAIMTGPGCPGTSAPQCNVGTQCGPVVDQTPESGAAPTAAGGTITPGLYFLTEFRVYGTSTSAETYQITINLGSDGSFWLNPYDSGLQSTQSAGTYSASGNMFSRTPSCPGVSAAYAHAYTATATTLALIETFGSGTSELIYTLQ